MGNTGIKYATKTWNPIDGCEPCSPGCDRCWARKWANRAQHNTTFYAYVPGTPWDYNPYKDIAAWDGTLAEFPARWDEPLRWRKPQRVFVGSRSDIALWSVESLSRLWVTVQRDASWHKYLILTKRPRKLLEKCPYGFENAFIGVTVCNQAEADEKIPQLLAIQAAGYWVSVEPMLGPVDLERHLAAWHDQNGEPVGLRSPGIDLVVVGGESGKGSRHMRPEWVRSLRDQCQAAGVPFWFKQWGDFRPLEGLSMSDYTSFRSGQSTIDGKQWYQLPDSLKLPGEV